MNISNLIASRDEILKAEIGALLFNLGKTHAGISNWKKYFPTTNSLFSSYKEYYIKNDFENDLQNTDIKLKNFIFNEEVKLPDNNKLDWQEFFKGDASNSDIIQEIFVRGCENINSGIDKGSPQDKNQLNSLWISNAFGSFLKEVNDENDFDNSRLCFLREFHRFLEDNNYYSSPEWDEIRNWVFNEIKPWYSRLLSDSRFPINDITLFDQAYMTASMFKAVLASLYLDNSNFQNFLDNPQSIKWSILGIQYDKLGLAEKGLKAASINWYRNAANNVDKDIKKIIEIEYALGNEVYRDETGIYFVVGENSIGNPEGDFYRLNDGLKEIKERILEVFTEEFQGEIYPAIFLTAPSRGLMNLGHLVEKSKENFLKAECPSDFQNKLKHYSNPNGICQICKMRLAHKGDKENLICDVCNNERIKRRIEYWLKNPNKETIWLDEIQDKNGRIALITLKFELEKWLNGDMLNSLVLNTVSNFQSYFNKMTETIKCICELYKKNAFDINAFKDSTGNFNDGFLKQIEKLTKNVSTKTFNGRIGKLTLSINSTVSLQDKNGNNQPLRNLLNNNNFKSFIRLYDFDIFNELSNDAYQGCKKNNETFDDFIKQIFFGSIRGNEWETLIKKSSINNKINWNTETIIWQNLTNQDIEFLAGLILQFLLRKNPSPARLRRIWESTEGFFKELESRIVEIADIKQERCERLWWQSIQIDDGEYEDGDLLFWADNKNVYLISSIEKLGNKQEFNLKKHGEHNSKVITTLKRNEAKETTYKPYFTILSPTPVSWQFIIPAENVPVLIENIQEEYFKKFRWVYGKLPLHIGIVVQNHKKPLYIGIKALRKIRRDKTKWQDLGCVIKGEELKARQKTAFRHQQVPEQNSQCEDFYSLYEKTSGSGKYHFYLYPEKEKVWLDTTANSSDTDTFTIYPNTFDFEFLDTNTRRNDIFYKNSKRWLKIKSNRPYGLYDWECFKKFKELFFLDKKSSSKIQKLVSIIYSKLEDWKGDDESLKTFILSAFVNILELKSKEEKDKFAGLLGLAKFEDLRHLNNEDFKKKVFMVLDMFDFWHTGLKFKSGGYNE